MRVKLCSSPGRWIMLRRMRIGQANTRKTQKEPEMKTTRRFYLSTAAALGFAALLATPSQLVAQNTVAIDSDDIGGVVTGQNGPEAGVWVIAETTDLPTRYAKMVVTDDQGRYVVPDLPKGKYKVWVRGYGLVDSPKVDGEPGKQLNLRAVPAPNDAAAAWHGAARPWRRGRSNRRNTCTERRRDSRRAD